MWEWCPFEGTLTLINLEAIVMYHKISSMCDKIRVIYDKSEQLRIMKYGHQDDPTITK